MFRVSRYAVGAAALLGLVAGCSSPVTPTDAAYQISVLNCHGNEGGFATGIAVTSDLVATAGHPFAEHTSFEVVDANGQPIHSDLVYLDLEKDVALLRLFESTEDFLPLGKPEEGAEATLAVFDGQELTQIDSVIINVTGITMDGENRREGLIISADIQPGDSGAGIVVDNRVVGIIFAKSRQSNNKGWAVSGTEFSLAVAELDPSDRVGPTC